MKKILILLMCMGLVLAAASVQALTLGLDNQYYVGNVVPAVPANETQDKNFLTYLVTMMAPGSTATVYGKNQTYNYTRSSLVLPSLNLTSFDLIGTIGPGEYEALYKGNYFFSGKYGNSAYYWFVSDVEIGTVFDLVSSMTQGGLSNITAWYDPGEDTPPVPEPGTIVLLGAGLLGLGLYGRRKMKAK